LARSKVSLKKNRKRKAGKSPKCDGKNKKEEKGAKAWGPQGGLAEGLKNFINGGLKRLE